MPDIEQWRLHNEDMDHPTMPDNSDGYAHIKDVDINAKTIQGDAIITSESVGQNTIKVKRRGGDLLLAGQQKRTPLRITIETLNI